MAHTHGDGTPEHSHGGSARGLGWELIDTIVLCCAVVASAILAELLYKAWRDRQAAARYDLTEQGRAVTEPAPPAPAMTEPGCTHPRCTLEHPHAGPAVLAPLVDMEALKAEVERRNLT